MSNQKTILIFSDWYFPGYRAGGPVQSVYNLTCLLSKHFEVRVVSRITDLNSEEPYTDIQPNTWTNIGRNHHVLYLNKEGLKKTNIKHLVKENRDNIIIINGLYSYMFSILPAFYADYYRAKHIFIAVRGMLHQSAMSIKPLKKRVFLAFAKGFGLYKSATFLSTGEKETEQISRAMGRVKIERAPNIPAIPPESFDESHGFNLKERISILFLGRIAPEKNPMVLIEALNQIKSNCTVTFVGTGIDSDYFSLFLKKISNLPKHIQHHHIPELPHSQIGNLIEKSDVMVLPSLGENFGHAIFESFVHAVPVIIGNNTPWTGIEEKKAGIEIDPMNVNQLVEAINRFIDMDERTYKSWKRGAFEVSKIYFRDNNFKEIYLRLFS